LTSILTLEEVDTKVNICIIVYGIGPRSMEQVEQLSNCIKHWEM